ncbi:hypothetical protein [Nocardia spumae]|uniref:hypothetical protein n=1 Tax=Nocardia spumae TaxID=2887190 RepID=UPI001D155894|nr:hypothetical protein [Nocardia spumae]
MKITGSRWRSFEYTPVVAGPCAVPLPPAAVGVPQLFVDCLLLRIVVEPGDCPLSGDAIEALRDLCAYARTSHVVIGASPRYATSDGRLGLGPNPSDVLAHIADTLDVLADIAQRLEELGERVHLIPFGWNLACRTNTAVRRPRPHCPHALVSARPSRHRAFRPHH